MAFDEDLAARIRDYLDRQRIPQVEEKRMFGGVGFLLNGNMLVGVWKDSLVARLGDDGEALHEPHVRPFDITGKPMCGWVLVDPEGLEADDQLAGWITRAMDFVRTLPAK